MLLDVDRMYRERAAEGRLRKIAPRRFNPTGEVWLPMVIHYQRDGAPEGRVTVVTLRRGPMVGQRVVRGREDGSDGEDEQK